MNPLPVIAIFDVGKTNKKLFLFDENYRIVYEQSARFTETVDEDGFPCENLDSLRLSIHDSLREVARQKKFKINAINFSTYGASFVYIDEAGRPVAPLYNYLKPYPEALKKKFYDDYGGEARFSKETASPVLGSLNSGMQLYRIRCEQPDLFKRIKYALHLPQYLSYLLSYNVCSDITSIGCHTNLWDFSRDNYHEWVRKEGIIEKLAPLLPAGQVFPAALPGNDCVVGIGLHDSSAALIPYLLNFHEPFLLLSTGTWCIALNPFNHAELTAEELQHDCLCYLQYQGKPVKASRVFSGSEHEQQVKRIASHFNKDSLSYREMAFDPAIIAALLKKDKESFFAQRELTGFSSDKEAYHQLMLDIMRQQYASIQLVLKGTPVKRIFVDGGFSKNIIFMQLLAMFFPGMEVFAASMAQATAMGAALCIHHAWSGRPLPTDIVELKYYSAMQ